MSGDTPHHPFKQRFNDAEESVGHVVDKRIKNRQFGANEYEINITGGAGSGSASGDYLPLDGSLPMEGNLDFDQHKALEMVFDSGTAFPTVPAPVQGQGFYRTDEDVFYIYDGADWQPVGSGGGTPSDTVSDGTSFGEVAAAGVSDEYSRGDHAHGTPDDPVPAHELAYDHDLLHAQAHDLLSADHEDTTAASPVKGDIITADGSATPKWIRLPRGADGALLTLASNLAAWTTATFPATCTKGGIIIASADNTFSVLAGSGTDKYVLTFDAATGLPLWAAIPAQEGDHLAIASETDTTPGTLWDKILVGPGLTRTLNNGGADETITLDSVITDNFSINVLALSSDPVDSETVYFGMNPKAPSTTAGINKIYIRKACTLVGAEIYCYSAAGGGTTENWSLYVRLNNTSDTLIATLGVNTTERVFSNAALNIALAVGDYIEIKGVQPAWTLNPRQTTYGGYLYFE